jgi:hypothetical protein
LYLPLHLQPLKLENTAWAEVLSRSALPKISFMVGGERFSQWIQKPYFVFSCSQASSLFNMQMFFVNVSNPSIMTSISIPQMLKNASLYVSSDFHLLYYSDS